MRRWIMVGIGLLIASLPFPAGAGPSTRVLVLPFDMVADAPVPALGPGTMDSMITALTRVPTMIVVDRNSLQQVLKEQALGQSGLVETGSALKLGKLMGANAIIAGRIQVVSGKVRLFASFIDATTGQVTRAEQVTGSLADIFDLQDQLADKFLDAQGVTLTAAQKVSVQQVLKATDNLTAYDYYQRGQAQADRWTDVGLIEAVDAYDKAIQADPGYALAIAGRARALSRLAFLTEFHGRSGTSLFGQAEAEARRAMAIKDDIPETYFALIAALRFRSDEQWRPLARKLISLAPQYVESQLLRWELDQPDGDPDGAGLMTAISINPRSMDAHAVRASALAKRQRFDEAITECRTAIALEPDKPQVAFVHFTLASVQIATRKPAEALPNLDRAIHLNGRMAIFHLFQGMALTQLDRLDEAISSYRQAVAISPDLDTPRLCLAEALFDRGHYNEALTAARAARQVHQATTASIRTPSAPYHLAVAQAAAKSQLWDEAIAAARQAMAERPSAAVYRTLGDALAGKGDPSAAADAYREALKLKPDDAEARKALTDLREHAGR